MAGLGGCTKIGALEVGKCGDMQGDEEFRVLGGWSGRNPGEWED